MKPKVALQFEDLFRVDDCDDGLPVYTEEFRRPINPDPPHPFEERFHPELRTSRNAVESEEFRKAEDEIIERVLAKMKLFIEDVGGKRLLSERL